MKFEVSEDGTLYMAGFVEPRTRAEVYDFLRKSWPRSAAELASALEDCQPLSWAVHGMYSEYRDGLQAELDGALEAQPRNSKQIAALKAELRALPEEPEDGAGEWLLRMSPKVFKTTIRPQVKEWLADEPDWSSEEDHLEHSTALGMAFLHFNDMDASDLNLLGVGLVEGFHPGDSTEAAELHRGIDEANRAARAAGLSERFVRKRRTRGSR